jgi:hypothetical protein
MHFSSFFPFLWKLVIDRVRNAIFGPEQDTAVRKDDILFIHYRYRGSEYLVSLPYKEKIFAISSFVTASLYGEEVTQQPGVPYTSSLPFIFSQEYDADIDTDLLLV